MNEMKIDEVPRPAPDRVCGDCRLCCRVLKVDEKASGFEKPQGRWCEHAGPGGCAIYDRRPKPCVTFLCAWLNGAFGDLDRPNLVHLVVALEMSVGDELLDRDGRVVARDLPVWCVYEAWPGCASKPRAQRVLELLERMTVRSRAEPDKVGGPYPICIIPSATAVRRIKLPGAPRYVPCLRPGESLDVAVRSRP